MIVTVFLVEVVGLPSMGYMVPEESSCDKYQPNAGSHLWSSSHLQFVSSRVLSPLERRLLGTGRSNWSSCTSMTLVFPRINWDAWRLSCIHVHAWKTEKPREVLFLLFRHHRSWWVVEEGQEKTVHSASMSEGYLLSLLPCQDGASYTYILLDSCLVFISAIAVFGFIFYFFPNSVSEQECEIFHLSVNACWSVASRAASTVVLWMFKGSLHRETFGQQIVNPRGKLHKGFPNLTIKYWK